MMQLPQEGHEGLAQGIVDAVVRGAPPVAVAVTALLALGWLGGRLAREFVDRQRWAELAVIASLLAIPLVLCPMDRFLGRALQGAMPGAELGPAAVLPQPIRGAGVATRPTPAPAIDPVATAPVTLVPQRLGPSRSTLSLPEASTGEAPLQGWDRVLARAYLAIAAVLFLRFLFGVLRLRRLTRRTAPVDPAELPVRLPGHLVVRRGPRGIRPFCTGLFRPVIVIPAELTEPGTLAAVLRHEAAHLLRRDVWSQWLFATSAPLLFPHPLFWLLRGRARRCAEIVTDADAARSSRTAYARGLLELAARYSHPSPAPVGAVTVFRRRSELSRRIEMLIDRNHRPAGRSGPGQRCARFLGIAGCLVVVAGTFGATAPAQDPKRSWTEEERREVLRRNDALQKELADLKARIDPQEDKRKKIRDLVVGPISFTSTTYTELFRLLSEASGAPIIVSPKARDILTRHPQPRPVGLVTRMRLDEALDHLTGSVKGLSWRIRHGVIVIEHAPAVDPVTTRQSGDDGQPPALDVADPEGDRYHVVATGDTLEAIARRYLGPGARNVNRLRLLNPSLHPMKLRVGERVMLPPATGPEGPDPVRAEPVAADPETGRSGDHGVGATRIRSGRPDRSAAEPGGRVQAMLLLIDRLVDSRAQLELAEGDVERISRQSKDQAAKAAELAAASTQVRAARRRLRLVQRLAEYELDEAKEVVTALHTRLIESARLHSKGYLPKSELDQGRLELRRAEFRVKMLKDALR